MNAPLLLVVDLFLFGQMWERSGLEHGRETETERQDGLALVRLEWKLAGNVGELVDHGLQGLSGVLKTL